jgi:hypothetical protein
LVTTVVGHWSIRADPPSHHRLSPRWIASRPEAVSMLVFHGLKER